MLKLPTIAITAAAIALTTTTIPLQARANCGERVERCEEALDKAFTALESEREYATELERQNNRLESMLETHQQLLEEKSAWYRDPLLIGIVGVALGTFIGANAARR